MDSLNPLKLISTGAGAILVCIGALVGVGGWTTVEPGEYAILIQQFGDEKGVQEDGLDVGTHWVNPITYDVEVYDTKARQFPLEVEASTKDGQPVRVTSTFEISLEPTKVKDLHSLIGRDYYDRVVSPAATAAIRDALPTQLSDMVYTDDGRIFIQQSVLQALRAKNIDTRGIIAHVNLQEIQFLNPAFVQVLERKASAAQLEEIQRREALAAEQEAIKVANTAEGQKQKRIKEAEAQREELRLNGEGNRLQQEEIAKGVLAVKTAEAEGQRLLVNAYGNNPEIVSQIEWAKQIGKNVTVYGIPTGSPGTQSMMDVNSWLQQGMSPITNFKGKE